MGCGMPQVALCVMGPVGRGKDSYSVVGEKPETEIRLFASYPSEAYFLLCTKLTLYLCCCFLTSLYKSRYHIPHKNSILNVVQVFHHRLTLLYKPTAGSR